MNRTRISLVVVVAALGLLILVTPPVFATNVSGVVTEVSGKPVKGAKVIAQTAKGQSLQIAVTSSKGEYTIKDLVSGEYRFALDPGIGTGFKKGQSVAAFVPDQGLTVDWTVSPTAEPLVLAQPATAEQVAAGDPFGLTWPQFALLGGAIVGTGTALGVAAAAGAFSGGSGPVASSSK